MKYNFLFCGMGDCSKHKKEVAGISDMKLLAEMIGDLHYETLSQFLLSLGVKLDTDARHDKSDGKNALSYKLYEASERILNAHISINSAWQISKPFMEMEKTH